MRPRRDGDEPPLTRALAALSGLTTRGRCLLAAGVALTLCSLALGQRDLLRAGVFLAVLPVAAVAVVARTRYRLACARRLEPPRVEAGRVATVRLRLDNVSRLPSGVLLMEDALPYTLGGRPRFVLDKIEPRGVRDVSYPVRADTRGRYSVGPLAVRLTDPFGLCELTRSFASVDDLIVTPVVNPLPTIRLGGDWAGGGDSTARSVAASGSDDAATREYRHGDDLRKVHWRSTARVGELMVRREEQPFQSRATLLLDGRLNAHRGDGPGSSYEYAVSAVASIAVSLVRAGFLLRLVSESGEDIGPPQVALTEGVVLDSLALVETSRGHSLAPATARLRSGIDGVLVAVLGSLDVEDAERLARLRVGAGTCIAVVLDVDSWAPISARQRTAAQQGADRTAALLSAGGWRILPVSYGTTLSSVWPLAAARGSVTGVTA
ncbi:MAG: hypothetical protein JWP11_2975 [Frankiales bacterium]|jgi:uncharacterized protein (DUF58 family)|nr:hypothetical protein [Frankiales bacterium]